MTETRDGLDRLIESWPRSRPPMSLHLRCEVAYAHLSPRKLGAGDPVPGCPCAGCTGITDVTPTRARKGVLLTPSAEWSDRVQRARDLSILEVADRLGVDLRQRGATCSGSTIGRPVMTAVPRVGATVRTQYVRAGGHLRLLIRVGLVVRD